MQILARTQHLQLQLNCSNRMSAYRQYSNLTIVHVWRCSSVGEGSVQEQEIHEDGSDLLGRAAPDKPKTSQLTYCTVAENYPLLHELQ